MIEEEIFSVLYDKEKWDVYKKFQQIEDSIDTNEELYQYFNRFAEMLTDDKNYIRVRSFRIICKLSKWDKDNKINDIIDNLLNVLDSDRPTDVRICLKSLKNLVLNKKELKNIIMDKVRTINYLKFKDTMSPLIKKDIDLLLTEL